MKKILVVVLFLCLKTQSQELIGKWSVASYEDSLVYYDRIKDSITYKDPGQINKAENYRQMFEFFINPITYVFRKNNEYELTNDLMMVEITGTYKLNEESKFILLTEENYKTDTIFFRTDMEMMYLKMKMSDRIINLGIRKISEE